MMNNVREFNERQYNIDWSSIRKGDIFYAELEEEENVQGGIRPVIIDSNDMNNKYCNNVQIVCVSSQLDKRVGKRPMPTHAKLIPNNINGLKCESLILGETVTQIPKSRLREKIGRLNLKEIKLLDKVVAIQIGLNKVDEEVVERLVQNIEETYRFTLRIKQGEAKQLMIKQVNNQIEALEKYLTNYNKTVDMYLKIMYNDNKEIKISRVA